DGRTARRPAGCPRRAPRRFAHGPMAAFGHRSDTVVLGHGPRLGTAAHRPAVLAGPGGWHRTDRSARPSPGVPRFRGTSRLPGSARLRPVLMREPSPIQRGLGNRPPARVLHARGCDRTGLWGTLVGAHPAA